MLPRHYCVECGKSFHNGKALGGHRSNHVQAAKNYSRKKKSYEPENPNSDNLDLCSEKYVCAVCEKEFKSDRSLYGHLRCHPEREYRGVRSPAMESLSHDDSSISGSRKKIERLQKIVRQGPSLEAGISDDSSEEAGYRINQSVGEARNLSKILSERKWGITGRRGQPGSIPHVSSSSSSSKPVYSSSVDEDVMNASYLLMCLKNSWVPSGKHPMIEYAAMCHHSKTKNPIPDAEDCTSSSGNIVTEALLDLRSQSFKNPFNEEDEDEVKPKVFKCPQCDNVYSCHQALGGHMSTHTKLENCGIQSEKIHQCKTCYQVFLSGQALGGHQSRHRNESSSSKAPFSEEDNSNPNVEDKGFTSL